MSKDGDRRRVLAFHLLLGRFVRSDDRHYRKAVGICFFPLEAAVKKIGGQFIRRRDFSRDGVVVRAGLAAIHAE